MRKKTFEDFKQQVYDLVGDEYTFYPPYKNMKTPIAYKHNKCGYEGTIRPDNFMHGARCMGCKRRKLSQERSLGTDNFKKRLAKINPNIEVIGEYKSITTPIACKCLVCGYGSDGEWTPYPNNLEKGKGCPNCSGNAKVSEQEARQNIINWGHNEYKYLGGFKNVNSKIKLKHLKCNHKFSTVYYSFKNGTRCPFCKESHGEQLVAEILDGWNVKYIRQKRFKDCRDKRPLPFDFYLPNFNLCIEYDGEQHSSKRSIYYSQTMQKHDQIKNQYCKDNHIQLIRISYKYKTKLEISNYLNSQIFSDKHPKIVFKQVPVFEIRPLMLKYHYLHRVVSTSFNYALYANGELVGMIAYSVPRLSLSHTISDKADRSNTLELSRLYIKDSVSQTVPNITSQFVSWSLRQLKKIQNWYIISFADSGMHHVGAIYQATNFLYCGKTNKYTQYAWNGYGKHGGHWEKGKYYRYMIQSSQKYRYVKFIGSKTFKKHARKELKFEVQSYPKADNVHYSVGDTEERLIRDRETGKIYKEKELAKKLGMIK